MISSVVPWVFQTEWPEFWAFLTGAPMYPHSHFLLISSVGWEHMTSSWCHLKMWWEELRLRKSAGEVRGVPDGAAPGCCRGSVSGWPRGADMHLETA